MTGGSGKGTTGELQRVIRVRDGLAITVGMIIGAGILGTPGLIAGYVGEAWTILGVWLLGGVVAGLSTLLFAEMAAALPDAGGKYVYARTAFGPLAGFVAGWSEIIVTRAFSGAAKAVLVAVYATSLAGRGSVPVVAGAVALAFFLLHMGGLKVGTRFQNITTVIKPRPASCPAAPPDSTSRSASRPSTPACSASPSPTRRWPSPTTAGRTRRKWRKK
jgi:APA family basic amino acid/polyamine antiporter